MANYFLTEELYGEIRKMLAWYRQQVGRGNADPMALDHEEHPTPDVYIARTGAQGIPASVLNFTATGTSTGSDLTEGPLGHGECVIYRADTYTALPKLLSMSFTKEVYNDSEIAVDPWTFIKVARDKYGTWWAGPPIAADLVPCDKHYRYFCEGGILREYLEDCDGNLTFLRNAGCCACPGTGTSDECPTCSSPAANLCVTLPNDFPYAPGQKVTLDYIQATPSPGIDEWSGSITVLLQLGVVATLDVTLQLYCGRDYHLFVTLTKPGPQVFSWDGHVSGSFCAFPQTILVAEPWLGSASYSCQVATGICPGDFTGTGTSGGNCPCSWRYSGGSWTQLSGSGSCIAPGLIPTPTEGEIRTTNLDGTTCSGGGGGSSVTCASIADTDGSWSSQGVGGVGSPTGIFASPTTGSLIAGGDKTWSGNSSGANFHLACVDDTWWMTFDGLNYAVEATLFYGALSFGFDFDDEQGSCRVIVNMNPA